MAVLPTPESAREMILATLGGMKMRPGYAVPTKPLMHQIVFKGDLTGDELANGLELMQTRGEIEEGPNGLMLTEVGFAAI